MKTFVSIALLTVLLAFGALGQTATPVTAPPVQVTLFGGGEYNPSGSPKAAVTLGGLYPFSATTSGGMVADLSFKSGRPTTVISGMIEQKAGNIGQYPVYLLAQVGTAFAASSPTVTTEAGALAAQVAASAGTNIGYSAATGVRTEIPLGKNLYLRPSARIIKGSLNDTEFVFGLVLASKVTVSK